MLTVENVVMECKIITWGPSRVVFALPDLGLLATTPAVIDVARVDGHIAKQQPVFLTAKPELEVVAGPTSEAQASPDPAAGQLQTGGLSPASLAR